MHSLFCLTKSCVKSNQTNFIKPKLLQFVFYTLSLLISLNAFSWLEDKTFQLDQAKQSFSGNWYPSKVPSIHSLTIAGFYFFQAPDTVQCPECGLRLKNWDYWDNPIEEHLVYTDYQCPLALSIWNGQYHPERLEVYQSNRPGYLQQNNGIAFQGEEPLSLLAPPPSQHTPKKPSSKPHNERVVVVVEKDSSTAQGIMKTFHFGFSTHSQPALAFRQVILDTNNIEQPFLSEKVFNADVFLKQNYIKNEEHLDIIANQIHQLFDIKSPQEAKQRVFDAIAKSQKNVANTNINHFQFTTQYAYLAMLFDSHEKNRKTQAYLDTAIPANQLPTGTFSVN